MLFSEDEPATLHSLKQNSVGGWMDLTTTGTFDSCSQGYLASFSFRHTWTHDLSYLGGGTTPLWTGWTWCCAARCCTATVISLPSFAAQTRRCPGGRGQKTTGSPLSCSPPFTSRANSTSKYASEIEGKLLLLIRDRCSEDCSKFFLFAY